MIFDDVVGYYLANTNHRSKWRDQYSLARLQPHFTGRPMADIRRVDVRSYLHRRQLAGVKLSTIRRELRFFSAAINYCKFELEVDLPNPVQSYALASDDQRVRWITPHEARHLLVLAGHVSRFPHLGAFIRLAINTGCRKGELLNLEWSRVDLKRCVFYLGAEHTKAAKRRLVPLNEGAMAAMAVLQDWRAANCPDNPWVFGRGTGRFWRIEKGFRTACARAGIDNFRIHDLRHTCASWLVMDGVDLLVVRDVLGHSSIAVTERYAHLAPQKVADAVARLPAF